jgi:uncharacterized delta-60 repeat protein
VSGLLVAWLVALSVPHPGQADPGDLDRSFGRDGKVRTSFRTGATASALVLQPDGKLVAAGNSNAGSTADFALARYHADGSLDATFGTGGIVRTPIGGVAFAFALLLQPDGKLVAAGFQGFTSTIALARYHADGSLDAGFGTGGIVLTPIGTGAGASALVLQPDGKLVAAGGALAGGPSDFALVRYHADGSLDPTFGTGGIVLTAFGSDAGASSLVLQPDGKLVAAGADFVLARYHADGSLDATFGTGGIVRTAISAGANALVLQPDGKLVAAGGFSHFALVRYHADGSLDATFGTGGIVVTAFGSHAAATALVLQPDGKLVAGGFDIRVTVCDPFGYFGCRSFRWAFALARYQGN